MIFNIVMVDNRANIDIAFFTPNGTQNGILKYGTRYAEEPDYIYIVNSKYRICRVCSYLVQGMGPATLWKIFTRMLYIYFMA